MQLAACAFVKRGLLDSIDAEVMLLARHGGGFRSMDEAHYYSGGTTGWWELGDSDDVTSRMVAEVENKKSDAKFSQAVYDAISSWQIYHFHDTGSTAGMRNYEIVQDNKTLRTDAANIGAFLLKLKKQHIEEYKANVNAVRLVTPFFDDFILEPKQSGAKKKVNISWTQKDSDYPMQPYHLSDGSIRFIIQKAV